MAKRKTYSKKKSTTKKKVGSGASRSKPSKSQLKAFMSAITGEAQEVQGDEGTKNTKRQRREGL